MPRDVQLQRILKYSVAGIGLFSAFMVHGLTEVIPPLYIFLFFGVFVAFRDHATLILDNRSSPNLKQF